MFAKYRKGIAQALVTVAAFVAAVLTDGITVTEWVLVAGVAVNVVGVTIVPNLDQGVGAVAKTVVSFLLSGLTVLATLTLSDGLSTPEILEVVLAACAAIGLTAVPNDWPPARLPASKVTERGSGQGVPQA